MRPPLTAVDPWISAAYCSDPRVSGPGSHLRTHQAVICGICRVTQRVSSSNSTRGCDDRVTDAARQGAAPAGWERHHQQERARCRDGCDPGGAERPPVIAESVEATQVQQEIVSIACLELWQARDVADHPAHLDTGRRAPP